MIRTHNLQELQGQTLGLPTHIGTWRPHPDNGIKAMTFEEGDVARGLITKRYRAAIKINRETIDEQFTGLYGHPLYFSDKITSTLVIRIKEVMAATGKSLKGIGQDIKDYLGKECSFYRKENGKQIPIDSNRIMDAYKLIQSHSPISEVEAVLYN